MKRAINILAIVTMGALANLSISAAVSIDRLLVAKTGASPLITTPVIISCDHKPIIMDSYALRSVEITGGRCLKQIPIAIEPTAGFSPIVPIKNSLISALYRGNGTSSPAAGSNINGPESTNIKADSHILIEASVADGTDGFGSKIGSGTPTPPPTSTATPRPWFIPHRRYSRSQTRSIPQAEFKLRLGPDDRLLRDIEFTASGH